MAQTEELVKTAETQAVAIASDVALLTKNEAALIISDFKTFGMGGDILKAAKAKLKWLDEDRKKITAPLDEAKAVIMAKYAPQVAEVEALKSRVSKKMSKFEEEERKRQEEEERKRKAAELADLERQKAEVAEAAASENNEDLLNAAAEIEAEQEAIKKSEPIKAEVKAFGGFSKTTYRDNWKYEVVNEALVPIDLKSTDDRKVKEKIKSGVREISGLRIYNDRVPISK